VTKLRVVVANGAHDGHAIELSKVIGHATLLLEFLFTEVTPSLKVIDVVTVLNESRRSGFSLKHVSTDNS
jgi:hypothetical protein